MAEGPPDDRVRHGGMLAGQMATLGGAFRARLARDRDSLQAQYAALATGADAAAALRQIELAAHKLHGTAAMFGYAPLGTAAGVVEHAARALLQDALARAAPAVGPAAAEAIAVPFAALCGELDAALADGDGGSGDALAAGRLPSPQTK